jgi:hypothetical protein
VEFYFVVEFWGKLMLSGRFARCFSSEHLASYFAVGSYFALFYVKKQVQAEK